MTTRTLLLASALLLAGCSDHKSEAKMLSPSTESAVQPVDVPAAAPTTTPAPKAKAPAPRLSRFYQVFHDAASIDPQGKPMLLVFGQPGDPYTQKLQKDVADNEALAKAIREDVTPIYIDARAQKRHKFMHNGEAMDVDTKTLVSIYHIDATPTLIFTDEKGISIFIVPGYMPPKQFEVTLQFVKEGAWKGKDRKDGEVYKALKAYYESHGVQVGGPKK